jgi:hypothetical protein
MQIVVCVLFIFFIYFLGLACITYLAKRTADSKCFFLRYNVIFYEYLRLSDC